MDKKNIFYNYNGYPRKKNLSYLCKSGLPEFEKILERNDINFTRFTIVQASQTKEKWEELNRKEKL